MCKQTSVESFVMGSAPRKGGYLTLDRKRYWCKVDGGKFCVYTHPTATEKELVMELRVDTASCELHVARSINIARITSEQKPTPQIAGVSGSVRSERVSGSHVVSIASPEQPCITTNNPLRVTIGEPTYQALKTAPKQLQSTGNRFSFNSEHMDYSVDDLSCSRNVSPRASGVTGLPSFTVKTKKFGESEGVTLTFQCSSRRNAEAAEWVDALIRARGTAIRQRARATRARAMRAHQVQENVAPGLKLLSRNGKERKALVLSADNALKDMTMKDSSNSNIILGVEEPIDALTIPLPLQSKCDDGTRRALQIDRDSEAYQEI